MLFSRNFDVLIEEDGVADRGTFIIDPDGVIQALEINAGGIGRDASTLVNKIKAAQYVVTIQVKFAQLNGKKVLRNT